MALLILIPLIIWAATDGRYRLVSERAGGIHFITKVDRFDADNACLILRAENRTTITIAHRLSTIIEADQIVVLENGEVAERGKHLDLLVKNRRYASMWNRQQQAAEAMQTLVETGESDLATPLAGAADQLSSN